jgi:hypothetical protein
MLARSFSTSCKFRLLDTSVRVFDVFLFIFKLSDTMDDTEYQDIFDWLQSKEASGNSNRKLVWPARISEASKEDGIEKNCNLKRGFREKAMKFHIKTSDGLLYRNQERKHQARPVLKRSNVPNTLISAHGLNDEHRGIKDM